MAYLCSVICTNCGKVYDNLISKKIAFDGVDVGDETLESYNYRCDVNNTFSRVKRRHAHSSKYSQKSEDVFNDSPFDMCLSCKKNVSHFGDRYHVELGNINSILKQKCPKCREYTLMLLEKKEV